VKIILHSLFITFALLFGNTGNGQKVMYHECSITDPGDFILLKWNISSKALPDIYIEEHVDVKGRVAELKYFYQKKLNWQGECGTYQWIKYEYPNDTTIVVLLFDGKGERECNLECGLPWKTTYFLSKDQKTIVKTKYENYIDTLGYLQAGWTLKEILSGCKSLESENKSRITDCVDHYFQSKAKLGGIFPIRKSFILDDYGFSEAETTEIVRILKKK